MRDRLGPKIGARASPKPAIASAPPFILVDASPLIDIAFKTDTSANSYNASPDRPSPPALSTIAIYPHFSPTASKY